MLAKHFSIKGRAENQRLADNASTLANGGTGANLLEKGIYRAGQALNPK
jgi:hypothetical protein